MTPPSVSATWRRMRSVWSRKACSGWSPSDARAAVGTEPNTVSGAAAARARLANEPPMPDVRRSSWAITSAHRHRESLGDRGRDGAVEERQAELLGDPRPDDAAAGSERRRERDDRCHGCSLPPGASVRGARLAAWVSSRGSSGRNRAAPACSWPLRCRGGGGVRRRLVRAVAAHRARGLGRHRRSVVVAVWVTVGGSAPSRRRSSRLREDDTRAGTHLLLLGAAIVEPGRGGPRLPEGERGQHITKRCCSRRRRVHDRVLVVARAHGVRAPLRAHLLHGAEGRHRLQGQGRGRTRLRRLRLHGVHHRA